MQRCQLLVTWGDLLLIQEANYVTYSLSLLSTARVRSYKLLQLAVQVMM